MRLATLARASDLARLLDLFRASEVSSIAEPTDRAERIWSELLAHEGVATFVADAEGKLAATCMLITAPNLLRGGRGHGFIDCYHVLLQSGRKDPRVHRFYESCGFESGVRVGYVARRP